MSLSKSELLALLSHPKSHICTGSKMLCSEHKGIFCETCYLEHLNSVHSKSDFVTYSKFRQLNTLIHSSKGTKDDKKPKKSKRQILIDRKVSELLDQFSDEHYQELKILFNNLLT